MSSFLTCVAISSTSAMAAATVNGKDMATKTTMELNGDNLGEATKNLEKQFSNINSNIKIDQTTGNAIVSTASTSKVNLSTLSILDAPNDPIPLTAFGVIAYGDLTGYYQYEGGLVSKSYLPLDFITEQLGNGDIIYVTIDGQPTTSYTNNKVAVATNDYGVVTEWADDITFDNSVISNLSNGTHTVNVTCSSYSKYTTGGVALTDYFYFDLEN